MKKITFLISAVCLGFGVNAQLFTDDFEGYTVGQYIGPASTEWTTWSGAEGGAEDAQATNAQANSGSNSIYFSSTAATGGPQDVILDFGTQYTSGTFTFEAAFFIDAGKNGYFNFQGETTPGNVWSLNCNMDGGQVILDDAISPNLAVGTYTDATWFTLRIDADLTLGRWTASIDGSCIGVWENGVNSIASLDLFPIQNSSFYVDDIMFDHNSTSYTLNGAVVGVRPGGRFIAGEPTYPSVTVGNGGSTTINSFDITIDYNGTQYTENVTGQMLGTGTTVEIPFTTAVPLVAGSLPMIATLSNVNGMASDDNANDDVTCGTEAMAVTPAQGKVVVSEEATGTWCPWCVRGTVYMDQFNADYGSDLWAGIAVHNGDPMTDAAYDAAIGPLIGGYPSSLVDRGADVDPSNMLNDFLTRIQIAPTAFLSNTSNWDPGTGELEVTVTADFQAAANSNYKLAVVITEDGVTGTESGYAQANAYAGGTNGEMGGYELLPSPVPAAQMVYDHVARGIQPSFVGDATVFPATVNSGDQHSGTYTFTVDPSWDINNIHVIGLLLDPTGQIDNASVSSALSSSIDEVANPIQSFNMYPNPAKTTTRIDIIIDNEAEVGLRILDMSGKQIATRDYGTVHATSTVDVNTSLFNSGVYLVELSVDGYKMTKRLVVE